MTDKLTWRDRLLALIVIVAVVGGLWLLVSCAPEPPQPEPLPTQIAQAETHNLYFPLAVVRSWPEFVASKRGVGMPSEYASSYSSSSAVASAGENSWYYNWSAYPTMRDMPAQTGSFYIPMLWDDSDWQWTGLLPFCRRGYDGPLLWLNEPDLAGQANTSPETAVAILERLLRECPGAHLVGPNLSHIDGLYGWPWLRPFLAAWEAKYGDWPPTTLAFHAYNVHPERILNSLREEIGYDGPVWVTEWGFCHSKVPGENLAMQKKILGWLEAEPTVERHAIFAAMAWQWSGAECNSLINLNGRLTAVGEVYSGRGAVGNPSAAYP